jgi:predicted phage gp36 major capsid-like protein
MRGSGRSGGALDLLEFPAAELYALPAATQTLLADGYAHIDAWLAGEVSASFSMQENAAFMTGDGTNKPKGFLGDDMIAEGSHEGDKIGCTLSGAAGAFAASNPASLLRYPATEIEDMPDIGANAFAIAFGDFLLGYLVMDRRGARVLRDPHSLKPSVFFYRIKHVGGGA